MVGQHVDNPPLEIVEAVDLRVLEMEVVFHSSEFPEPFQRVIFELLQALLDLPLAGDEGGMAFSIYLILYFPGVVASLLPPFQGFG